MSVSTYFLYEREPHRVQKGVVNKIGERQPASVKKIIPLQQQKPESELQRSGLAPEKVAAIIELRDFHDSLPAFNDENKLKRQTMLEVLVKNPNETVEVFTQLMQKSKDDGLKSFLLNLTMNSPLEDEDKAQIFLARIKIGANFSNAGVVPDEQVSFMIGVSHLSRLENDEVKNQALAELKNENSLMNNPGFKQLYQDYFNETL